MSATAPVSIRAVDARDLPFLWDMPYEAAIVAPEIRTLRRCGFDLVESDDPAIGTSLLMKAELTVSWRSRG